MQAIAAIVSAALVLGLLDFLWLGTIAKKVYYDELGDILLKKPRMVPALLFYGVYILGTTLFVILPALGLQSWSYAAGYGAMFGFICYATYDLTNLATIKGFSMRIVIIDLLWGSALTAVTATASYFVASLF